MKWGKNEFHERKTHGYIRGQSSVPNRVPDDESLRAGSTLETLRRGTQRIREPSHSTPSQEGKVVVPSYNLVRWAGRFTSSFHSKKSTHNSRSSYTTKDI
ncbi:hypothetical protein CDAR_391191 [Caerostris darwini]|uniref:Uncharacterized protein n=1 Tax=Caerostris darwini TaxID=1538125 RepID=A0AAV4SV95_9ARAC|nr:hypothetical protein CDAR_391191 [Caerostris darwini]